MGGNFGKVLTGVPDRLNEDTENDMKSMKHEMLVMMTQSSRYINVQSNIIYNNRNLIY
jgi:hypothetical protein